jgi:hypothetical protein
VASSVLMRFNNASVLILLSILILFFY